MRPLHVTAAIAALAVAGGCSQPVAHVAGDAHPVTEAPTAAAPSTPAADTPTTGTPVLQTSPTARPSATNPCPVSVATLLTAIRESPTWGDDVPDSLHRFTCYQGFAYAQYAYRRKVDFDAPYMLFKFDVKAGKWKALNIGSGGVCDGYVAYDRVQERLGPGC